MKIKPADKAFADCLKFAHDYTCERCGKQGRMETSHVLSRRHRTVRWDSLNANCLCHYCHRIWHESPLEAHRWFTEAFGEDRMELLIEKREYKVKVSKLEEKDIAKHYRDELSRLQELRSNGVAGVLEFVSYQ